MKLEAALAFVISIVNSAVDSVRQNPNSLLDASNYLPPNMQTLQSPDYIFSGFRDSYAFNLESESYNKILGDLEEECSLSNSDLPFFSRLFVASETKAYYYCPKANQIYLLSPQNNFSKSGDVIPVESQSPFSEVKFLRIPEDDDTLLLLGLINKKNLDNTYAHNYTASYTVTIDLAGLKATEVKAVVGAHNEPIVDMKMAVDGKVIATGEKLYKNNMKLNTYYLDTWDTCTFNKVVDFYLSKTHSFMPHVKLTSDGNYIIYTNQDSIFSYNRETLDISKYSNVTYVSKTYEKEGSKWMWEEIAFTISNSDDSLYVYSDKSFIEMDIPNMQQSRVIPLPDDLKNSTDFQFYFLRNNSQDMSLIQYNQKITMLNLSSGQVEGGSESNSITTFTKQDNLHDPNFLAF